MTSTLMNKIRENREEMLKSDRLQFDCLRQISIRKDIEAIELYIELGFNLNVRNSLLETVLFDSYVFKNLNIVQFLVDKGLNIFALDSKGEHMLFEVANECSNNVELLVKFLLEKGLNPYLKNQKGRNVFEEMTNNSIVSADFIREHSLFEKEDTTYYEYLQEQLYPLALTISESNVQLAGGINQIIPYLNSRFIQKIVFDYQNSLILNKKYEEATLLTECFVKEENELNRMSFSKRAFSIIPAFMTKDESAFFNAARTIYNHSNYTFLPKTLFIYRILEKAFSDIYPASKEIKYYMDLEWNNLKNSMSEGSLYNLFFTIDFESKKEVAISQLKSIEQETEPQSDFLRHIEYLFLLGMSWFYLEEYFNAEYYFTKVVQACKENLTADKCEFEFVHSTAMLDCIQRKREE